MPVTRRSLLKLAGLMAAAAGLSGCSPLVGLIEGDPTPAGSLDEVLSPEGFRRLSRVTYGPTQAERARVAEIGLGAWLEEQLDHQVDEGPARFRWRAVDLGDLEANALAARYRPDVTRALKQATLLRRLYSRRQLYEAMVEFWSDHFNISLTKGECWYLKTVDDREVVRRHALGNFRELLHASAHSGAMLVYLDNHANHKDAPNENYARELLELHTLGVDGGYGQSDVMELARCLTGWTVKDHFWQGEFRFDPARHDDGPKLVLGRAIEPAGASEAEGVLDRLATHPSTARHLAFKLARRFVSDDPERDVPGLVERAARAFLDSGGEIRALLRTVLYDGLLAAAPLPPKFKRPLHFVASALRLAGASTNGGAAVQRPLARMGQPLFEWPTPDGPPDDAARWLHNLLPRWEFALALAHNQLQGTQFIVEERLDGASAEPGEALDQLGTLLLGAPLTPGPRDALLEAVADVGEERLPATLFACLVASPAFQWT